MSDDTQKAVSGAVDALTFYVMQDAHRRTFSAAVDALVERKKAEGTPVNDADIAALFDVLNQIVTDARQRALDA
jgi:hypothetical protein